MKTPTAADCESATRRLYWFARRHGVQDADARDMAQDTLLRILTKDWKTDPEDLHHAVSIQILVAKRCGVAALTARPAVTARRAEMDRQQRGEPAPYRQVAPPPADPARVAEQVEQVSFRRRRLADRLGIAPQELARLACGVAPVDPEEVSASPVVTHGPGYTPPAEGCPGLVGSTDPNDTREASRWEVRNEWRRVAGMPPVR